MPLYASLRVQVRCEILAMQRRLGLTTIFVMHDQEEANTVCDRIVVMNEGVVQQVDTPMELYDNPANLFVGRRKRNDLLMDDIVAVQISLSDVSIFRQRCPPLEHGDLT